LLGVLNLAMGMLSNTLSYLRLLALGLVTGALALAVNLVASQISAMLPLFLGIPVAIIIYLAGHTLNLALNTLGAFIHSGRLQFVEFFSNFFEGGGRPFTPFKRSMGA
jgi:V/A-type H+/Na+-transporting ATPase subunit I